MVLTSACNGDCILATRHEINLTLHLPQKLFLDFGLCVCTCNWTSDHVCPGALIVQCGSCWLCDSVIEPQSCVILPAETKVPLKYYYGEQLLQAKKCMWLLVVMLGDRPMRVRVINSSQFCHISATTVLNLLFV